MGFWPNNLKDWVDIVAKALATLFAVFGGMWALYQYFGSIRLKAAETLLKVEEEFRVIFPVYEEIDYQPSYDELVKPVFDAERDGSLRDAGRMKLTQLDRCFRFLYLCSVLNDVLGADRALKVPGGVLIKAYYYYIGILVAAKPPEEERRPELLAYAQTYYPKLTNWVKKHESELRDARKSVARV